jgi:hypothetical protein
VPPGSYWLTAFAVTKQRLWTHREAIEIPGGKAPAVTEGVVEVAAEGYTGP